MDIKILSYNFFQRPIFIKSNESDYKGVRVDLFKKYFKEYDIICFQELFGSFNKRKNKLLKLALENGFKYISHTDCPNIFNSYIIDSGLVVVSRYPILEVDFQVFPFSITFDGLSKKGILYVKIQIKDKILNIFNTHTQSSFPMSDQKYYNKLICCRYIQIFENSKFILNKIKYFKKNELIIYLGDFNINSLGKANPVYSYNLIKDRLIKYDSDIYYNSIINNTILEYNLLFNTLIKFFGKDVLDIMKYENDNHLVTYGDVEIDIDSIERPKDNILTNKPENTSKQCLDYIFLLNPNSETSLKYVKNSFNVEKFLQDEGIIPTQLSDHYGLSIIIK